MTAKQKGVWNPAHLLTIVTIVLSTIVLSVGGTAYVIKPLTELQTDMRDVKMEVKGIKTVQDTMIARRYELNDLWKTVPRRYTPSSADGSTTTVHLPLYLASVK